MIYIGADPGKGGAIAWCGERAIMQVANMPETDSELWRFIRATVLGLYELDMPTPHCRAIIERVSAGGTRTGEGKARMGVTSAFTFGQQVGRLHMAFTAAGIPYDIATPQRWQGALGCLTKGDKHVSKRRAEQLFPSVKVTLKNADALLIAEYCRRVFSREAGA
jgi:hypothetical protein